MIKYGLSEEELHFIVGIIALYTEIEVAVLFGSRAMGSFKKTSDIDIALKGVKVDFLLATRIKNHFEGGTTIPYFFDVIDYNTIDNVELKKHIDELGIIIYEKK